MRTKILVAATASIAALLKPSPDIEAATTESDERLIGAHIFFRHGARTPVFEIECDKEFAQPVLWDRSLTDDVAHTMIPHRLCNLAGQSLGKSIEDLRKTTPTKALPGGALNGELTQTGQREMFDLGRKLRRRYSDQVDINLSKFYFRSTRYPRTIASMRCVVAGLLDWQPGDKMVDIPKIHVNEFVPEETLAPNRHACAWVNRAMTDFTIRDIYPGILGMRETVIENLGPESLAFKKHKDGEIESVPTRLYGVRDYFTCQQYHDIPIPKRMTTMLKEMDSMCACELATGCLGPEKHWKTIGLKAVVGPMSTYILQNCDNLLSSDNSCQKFLLFSTHDNMVLPLLLMLDCYDDHWPKFGADLIIELYELKDKSHVVRIYYCDKFLKEMPFSEFRKKLQAVATDPETYREICSRDYHKHV